MSRIEVQEAIIENLEKVDEVMLLAVQSMLDTYLAVHAKSPGHYLKDYDKDGNLLNRSEMLDRFEATNDRIDAGEEGTTSLETVNEKIGKWLRDSQ